MVETITIKTGAQAFSPALNAALDRFFLELGQGFNAYLATRQKLPELERLYALGDDELAAKGIARDDIPRHVFRDVL